jgi:hypothetical protein
VSISKGGNSKKSPNNSRKSSTIPKTPEANEGVHFLGKFKEIPPKFPKIHYNPQNSITLMFKSDDEGCECMQLKEGVGPQVVSQSSVETPPLLMQFMR